MDIHNNFKYRFHNKYIILAITFFKNYGEKNISCNLKSYQELKQRLAMAKEAFNRKRSIFCRSLQKELRKRLMKCFVWNVALYGAKTWALRRNEQKRLEAFEMWIWRRMERIKWTDTK